MTRRLFKFFDRDSIEREVEEEFSFHLEQLTRENLRQDMSAAEAKGAALNRFGDVEHFKDECVEISKRRTPFVRLLKCLLLLIFSMGVLLRILNADVHLSRVGDILIFIAILSRVLLHLRGLNPSRFTSRSEIPTRLILNEHPQQSVHSPAPDGLTPVERMIADK